MLSRASLLLTVIAVTTHAQVPARPADSTQTIYFAFQVEKQVSATPRNKPPQYPMVLRASNIEGEVLAKFAVDSTGQVILSTFSALKSNHELFTQAVRDALPGLRFTPAQIGKRRVAQLVQMPFVFSLAPTDTGTTVPRLPR